MSNKRKRGRPMQSGNVHITPEFREMPDIEKLGRALIAIAMNNAKGKRAEEPKTLLQTSSSTTGGDSMT